MRYILTALIVAASFVAKAQISLPIDAKWDYYKQNLTIYTDSPLTAPKSISTDFLKLKLISWNGRGWKAERSGLSHQPVEVVYVKDDQLVKTYDYRLVLENLDPKFVKLHQAYHDKLVKAYGKKIANGMFFGVPVIGMNKRQFFMCEGRPDKTNTTETAKGTSEQFVYYGSNGTRYYYFTNGKLTAQQY